MLRKYWITLGVFGVVCSAVAQQTTFFLAGKAQGTTYHMQYVAENPIVREASIDSIIDLIDQSMSLYQPHSSICVFNRQHQKQVVVDTHMMQVLREAFRVHDKSKGLFDITVKPLVDLWSFGTEEIRRYPSKAEVDSVLSFVGMDQIWLEDDRLVKNDARVSIDLNGIAQGYTVDVLAEFLTGLGIVNYLVELGGEIRVKGTKIDGNAYEIAVERPGQGQSANWVLSLEDGAVTTSGNYRKQDHFQQHKIHHHLHPKTGYPVQNTVISATVIAPTAMEADAYDNVFMALSPEEGIALANQLPGMEVYLIYEAGDAILESFSDEFKAFIKR